MLLVTADLEQQQHNSNGNNNRLSSLGVISSSTNNTTSTYQQPLKSNQNIANTLVNEALQLSSPDNNNESKLRKKEIIFFCIFNFN